MLRDLDIVCVSWLEWDWLPLVMHHMMTRLSRTNRVLFVDPPVALTTAAAHPSLASHVARKVGLWRRGLKEVSPNLHVLYPPPVLVDIGHLPALDAWNYAHLGRAVRGAAKQLGLQRPLLWLYSPYTILPDAIPDARLLCYDCNDDISSFAGSDRKRRRLRELEQRLARRADIVFATSRQLLTEKQALNANTHYFPSGLDFELFNRACQADTPVPADAAALKPPVICYVGAITNHRLEWDWVRALARDYPEATQLFIGPHGEPPPADIKRLPNLHLIGPRKPEELAGYLKISSVGTIPYKGREFLDRCQPTKTFEYLAAGLPVVAADIPELRDYGALVRCVQDAPGYVRAVRDAVALRAQPDVVRQCVDTARGKTWDARIAGTSALLERLLQERGAAPADATARKPTP